MSSFQYDFAIPGLGEWLTPIFTVAVVFAFGGLALLLVRTLRGRRETRTLDCPGNGERVTVTLNQTVEGTYDSIAECSRWKNGRPATCHDDCLPRAV